MKSWSRICRGVTFLLTFLFIISFIFTPAWSQQKTIKFGCSISLTGKLSKEGYMTKDGLDLWVWWCNEKLGGINIKGVKHKVEVKYYDDESSPERTVKLIEKLITDDGIKLLFSPYSSGLVFAGSAVSEKHRVLMVNVGGTAEKIFERGFKYFITCLGTTSMYFKSPLDLTTEVTPKPKTVAMIWENELASQNAIDGALDKSKELGYQVIFKEMYPKGTKDISSLMTNIKAKKPDIFILGGHFSDSILGVRQSKDLKFNPKMMLFMVGPVIPDFVKTLGKDAENIVGQAFWTPEVKYKDPVWGSAEVFTKEFVKKYNFLPDYHAADGGIGGAFYQMVIEKAGSTDSTVLRDTVAKMDIPSTLVGPVKINEKGINIKSAMIVVQIQNGKPLAIWPKEIASTKFIFPKPPWE